MQPFVLDRRFWILPVLFWAILAGISLSWNLKELRQHQYELMDHQGRLIFTMVESIRLWNAKHGGVYAPVTANSPPNPYLVIDERDIESPSGRPLTLINPAYMTRQLSGLVNELSGVEIYLTSLKPLNPANIPRDWEDRALRLFEQRRDVHKWSETAIVDGQQRFRYIAPLITQQACLSCHAHQGYQLGEIRGGISVSFPTAQIVDPVSPQDDNLSAIHLIAWLLLSLLSLVLLMRFRHHLLAMQQARDEQEQLVEERTLELRHKAQQHQKTENQLGLILSSSGEGIFALDAKGRFTHCNPAALHYLGYLDERELLGRRARNLLCPDSNGECSHCLSDCFLHSRYEESEQHHVEEGQFRCADGSTLPVEYRASAVRIEGELVGSVISFADISERQQRQEQIWRQANFDALTGLNNRHAFEDLLKRRVQDARRYQHIFALLFIDLDGFKAVNDNLGHDAGDAVLKEVATRLSSHTRESDIIARIGGDEFTVLLPECDDQQTAAEVARKLIHTLAEPIRIRNEEVRISASIGIALYPEHGKLCDTLLSNADHAMYEAKNQGKNRFIIYQK